MDCQVNSWGGDYPHFEWNANNPTWVTTYWDTYIWKVYRHSGTTSNMLYLDGHVAPMKTPMDGGQPFVTLYYSSP